MKKCPSCKSKNIAEYVYGDPINWEETEKEIDAGKIILGGCCVGPGDPEWECNICGRIGGEFYDVRYKMRKECPSCHSKNVAEYVYGDPNDYKGKEIQKQIDKGKIRLGGSDSSLESHRKWACIDCEKKWGFED